uniref:Uncharacterized protein n=1 Tax=Podoviridae sp. ctiuS14 TaxID=2827620 RepID=A0A8S5LMU2_9CAUD|nr:MAG TPA: hypothetical protein [Podoviridae sp. ctiuS14]
MPSLGGSILGRAVGRIVREKHLRSLYNLVRGVMYSIQKLLRNKYNLV